MKIFLDDVRQPPDDSWLVVRSVPEFKNLVNDRLDDVEVISFDHDLGENTDSGYDAMKWLVFDKEFEFRDVQILVHSANPVGAKNIRMLYNRWISFLNSED